MVLNAAVQMLREAEELKETISKFKSGTSMLQERSLWASQQQLQKIYQKVLVLDLDYALDKKVEQDLWNIGFKQQIEALQAISKDRKNPLRSEGQAMLSWVLQAAAGFYLCLLHQICTTFQLDLPFRRRASLLGCVESWGAGAGGARLPAAAAARYICQHCLVHLGDLARYRQQMRVAHSFYRHALVVSVECGQPYNQLALVSWRRGRRLAAVYWHVRSLLVRAPFPPAQANLARTLRAAAAGSESKQLPVLPGVTPLSTQAAPLTNHRLDAHSYVTELIRALHYIHSGDELETAKSLVISLNSSLITLVATDSFESMTLVKIICILIWLVQSSTEEFTIESSAVTEGEALAAQLSCALAGGALLALLLPSYMSEAPVERALPAMKVFLEWSLCEARVVPAAWGPPALLPALAHTLNTLATPDDTLHKYSRAPLAEDEELHGFLPLEGYLKNLRFPNHAAWDTYAARVPTPDDEDPTESPQEVASSLQEEPELQRRVRAHRLVQLGKRIAHIRPEQLSYTMQDSVATFTAASAGGEQLTTALASLHDARGRGLDGGRLSDGGTDDDSDDDGVRPPVVISEADFREKVREKRAGILKPQGSLERSREERALLTQDEQEEGSEEGKCEDKRESRKQRVNIAMAAIMRKQEETNKQVKFVTPPPTPESLPETENKDDKPKVVQPKAVKSLANIPVGRKTGGILSLKDKSGYPHLVNTDEPKKDKEEKKEAKNSQNYQKKMDTPTWPEPQFNEPPRMTFQKNYGIQNAGIIYNPNYQPSVNNQGIRLPVVNPKEIDVRTAAMQKQNSRQDVFQEGKFNYQMSGDKKNFLNDLPPRFANQYRYWQAAQENQFNDNKFRDDSFKTSVTQNSYQPPTNWMGGEYRPEVTSQPPPSWWKPDFNYMKPNYFPVNNPPPNFQNPSYPTNFKQKEVNISSYPSTIGPPLQTLQNLVSSPNFTSSLGNFAYPPPVQYDAAMYPQFNNLGYRMQAPKPPSFHDKEAMDPNVGFGNNVDVQNRMNFNDPVADVDGNKMEQKKMEGGCESPSTYSLFSGAPAPPPWGHAHPPQSLWSGPGPSPLERLLEQQKQAQQPPH